MICFKPVYVNYADILYFDFITKQNVYQVYVSPATEVLEERIRANRGQAPTIKCISFATRKCKYNGDFLSLSIVCCSNV